MIKVTGEPLTALEASIGSAGYRLMAVFSENTDAAFANIMENMWAIIRVNIRSGRNRIRFADSEIPKDIVEKNDQPF